MAATSALDAGNITEVSIVVLIALVVLGVLVSLLVTALLGRLLVLAVVVVLGIVVWVQRTSVQHAFTDKACHLDTTFFGVHLDPPDSVRQACRS